MNYLKGLNAIFIIIFLLVFLVACGNLTTKTPIDEPQSDSKTITPIFTETARPLWTLAPLPSLSTRTPLPTAIPTVTINPAYQPWLATSISISGTKSIEIDQVRETAESEIEQFVIVCEGVTQNAQYDSQSPISPSKNWVATGCGRQNLLVQNRQGTKRWVLEFEDFLHPNLQSQGTPGRVYPVFWDAGDSYLYFSTGIGWSGGGDECFSRWVTTGLFRLNLKNGTWVTLVNPSEYFPGDHIEVSPTGRRYVSDINGILITDVYTGEVIQISASGVMAFRWSPDGTKLAYSTSTCNEEGFVTDSSVSIWDASTNEVRTIFTVEKEVLTPIEWDDNSVLKFEGEKYIGLDAIFTMYVINTITDEILFIGPSSALYK